MTRWSRFFSVLGGIWIAALAPLAQAQQPPLTVSGARIQKIANGVLGLMGYSVVPDLTSSTLAIDSAATGNPNLTLSQLAGGFTLSRTTPVYLEGGIAYSRFDPTFIASNGQEARPVPLKWVTGSLSGGVGWDFPIAEDLVVRPIFNCALGRVASDLRVATLVVEERTGKEIDFLDRGHHDAYGLGGSLMLDYERVRPDQEIDVELRYTAIRLQSFGSSDLKGHADAITTSLYTRYRAPTGMTALDRPVRTSSSTPSPTTSATSPPSASATCIRSAPAWSSIRARTTSSSPAPAWWAATASATTCPASQSASP